MANDVKHVLIFLAVCFKKSHTMSQMLFHFHCIEKKRKKNRQWKCSREEKV